MILKYNQKYKLFYCVHPADESYIPKEAGLQRSYEFKCWVTADEYIAYKLRKYADISAEMVFQKMPKDLIIVRSLAIYKGKNPFIKKFIMSSLTILNPKWIENEKMGRWNQNTDKHLIYYSVKNDHIYFPRGFISCVGSLGYEVEIQDKTYHAPQFEIEFTGKLKSYQKKACKVLLQYNIGVLSAATGSGKTVMGLYVVFRRAIPAIIIVHTKELLYQWAERIKTFLGIDAGLVGAGKCDLNRITVALVQTLKNKKEILNGFSHLIVDECHLTPSTTFIDIVKTFGGKYITGLSATPYRRDGLSKLIEWFCGPIRYEVPKEILQEEGHIANLEVKIRETNFQSVSEGEYSQLLSEIANDFMRNKLIIKDIRDQYSKGRVGLVLSDRKEHCKFLYDQLKLCDAALLTGDTNIKERKRIVADVNSGKVKILIATGQLIGEGFDCEKLSVLFLTMPVKFKGRVFQYVGRILRPKKKNNAAIVFDYYDKNVRCLHAGFKSRIRVYNELKGENSCLK